MVWSVDTLCLTGISVTLNTLEINWWIIWIKVVDICFMFNLLTMLDELFTTQWRREIAAVFVLSCCVFTQFAIIGKCLTTLITAVNLFIIILFTITFIITLVVGDENSITVWTDLLPALVHEGRAAESGQLCTLSQALRCCRRRGFWQLIVQLGFFVLHPGVLPQPLFRDVFVITLFLERNSSLRLAFLLWVEGLDFFFATGPAFALLLVSKEKVKVEPMLRVKWNGRPWLASAWQKSMHLEAREQSASPVVAILSYFWIMELQKLDKNILRIWVINPVYCVVWTRITFSNFPFHWLLNLSS